MSEPVVVRVPQINPNDEHAIVVRWHVAKGARVEAGQSLLTMETTKTTFDVDAPAGGFAFFEHEPNTELAVGAPVAVIADSAEPSSLDFRTATQKASNVGASGGSAERFTRKARKLMKERGLTEADFESCEHVDADTVERIARARSEPRAVRSPHGVTPLALSASKVAEVQTLRRVREQVVPSTVAVAVDSAWLDERLKREAAQHGPISVLELAIYETARMLKEWPELNAFYADGQAYGYDSVAIGFAVNLGRALRVPVVKDAARLPLPAIARTVRELTLRYLRDELTIDDVTDGTFTITDLSGEGVVHFVPVLNERQAAILGLCAARRDGSRELVLTFDHRLSDGMRAGRFLAALGAKLEQNAA